MLRENHLEIIYPSVIYHEKQTQADESSTTNK